mmetsp:Transcript_22564/g.70847  ORF Transcript_22564/g.70847 Transcript_22564/m.70847 type:complete len:503 (+) Transcript_22564:322-1830(+)|eukprot:scaffold3208_cov113-Isochrysis_galbana.AAC.2
MRRWGCASGAHCMMGCGDGPVKGGAGASPGGQQMRRRGSRLDRVGSCGAPLMRNSATATRRGSGRRGAMIRVSCASRCVQYRPLGRFLVLPPGPATSHPAGRGRPDGRRRGEEGVRPSIGVGLRAHAEGEGREDRRLSGALDGADELGRREIDAHLDLHRPVERGGATGHAVHGAQGRAYDRAASLARYGRGLHHAPVGRAIRLARGGAAGGVGGPRPAVVGRDCLERHGRRRGCGQHGRDATGVHSLGHGSRRVEDGVAEAEAEKNGDEELDLVRHGHQHQQVAQRHLHRVQQPHHGLARAGSAAQQIGARHGRAAEGREGLGEDTEEGDTDPGGGEGGRGADAPRAEEQDDAVGLAIRHKREAIHVHGGAGAGAEDGLVRRGEMPYVRSRGRGGWRRQRLAGDVATGAVRFIRCPDVAGALLQADGLVLATGKRVDRLAHVPAQDLVLAASVFIHHSQRAVVAAAARREQGGGAGLGQRRFARRTERGRLCPCRPLGVRD